jgi:uncharacterized membrane protein YfhO
MGACFPEAPPKMRAKDESSARRSAPAIDVPRKNRLPRFVVPLAGLCLLFVGALIFREFLFGGAVLLYTDMGSDSVNSYYPDFVSLSNYVRREGFPSWSFYVGMGQDLAYATGYLIWQPVSWLPNKLIAPALVFQHLGKVLIAGLFFFRFLQLRRLRSPVPLLGALLLSFSAYMCTGSCWYPFSDEVVCFAGILLGTEEAIQHGRWLLLALAVALVGMITPFHLYLCALFLTFYVPLRLFGQYGWQPRIILRHCLKLAGIAALGVGLGAIVTLPYLQAVLNSPRGSGTTSAVAALSSFPFFGFESLLHYTTAALKPFANDILGTGNDFHGWQNYLEAPLTYCGLLCLLLLPQALRSGSRRERSIYLLFLLGMLVPTVLPWFRYLFWLFQGDYYRIHSLFWILGLISLCLITLSRYIEGRTLNLWLLAATTLILAGILYLPIEQWKTLIDPSLRIAVTAFLFLYGILLTAGQLLKRQKLAAWLILGISALELVQFDQITVSNRKTVKKEDLNARVGYNDETINALQDITTSDDEKFFRITKLRPSGPSVVASLNDAMVFGYYGTSSYSSFNNINYINFLTAVNAIPPNAEAETRWSVGLLNDSILSLFAGEKYALVDDPLPFQRTVQYEFVKRYEKDYLFRNARFLPFGLTFSRYITQDAFLSLPAREKPAVLLHAVVLSNQSEGERLGLAQTSLSDLEQDARTFSLADVAAARRKTGLKLTSFGQTRFEGNVSLDRKSILVLQTPFDQGWRAILDGQAVPALKVDAGMLGVGLDAGEHKVELQYRNRLLVPALLVTLLSLVMIGAGLWRWPRLSLPA